MDFKYTFIIYTYEYNPQRDWADDGYKPLPTNKVKYLSVGLANCIALKPFLGVFFPLRTFIHRCVTMVDLVKICPQCKKAANKNKDNVIGN